MKKILLGICSLAFVSCLSAGIALNNSVEVANAETSVFTETKCQISNDGDKMLVVTGITDVSAIYEVGYYVDGEKYVAGEGETAETNKYYQSLTLGSTTKTAAVFYNNDDVDGLLVWEIAYDSAKAYSIQPYALVGTWDGGVLIAPEEEVPTVGTEKENFNVLTVTFVDEEGNKLGEKNVNYGATVSAIEAPEAKDWYEFDGWYLGEEKYDFEQPIEKNIELTAKYVKSKTMVFSVDKGNIESITTKIGEGSSLSTKGYHFANTNAGEVIDFTANALQYTYAGDKISANQQAGLVFNLGEINIDDYDTIKITYQAENAGGGGALVYINNTYMEISKYGGAHEIDLKAAAKAKNIGTINTFEISAQSWVGTNNYTLYIASIELVLADKVVTPEVPVGPQSVTYSIANGNINDIVSSINGDGTYGTIGYNFDDGKGGVVALTYTIQNFTPGSRTIGIVFDLGEINIADYKSIKITYQALTDPNSGSAIVYLDGTEVANPYGGKKVLDLKELAKDKVESFSKIELSLHSWSTATTFTIYIASIELVVAD